MGASAAGLHRHGGGDHRKQAAISGAFSVTHQAVQFGFLPCLKTLQTSAKAAGQIYIPAINWGLLAMVLGFGGNRPGSPRPMAFL